MRLQLTSQASFPFTICLSRSEAVALYILYSFLSLYAWMMTSGGWTGIAIFMVGWVPYALLFFVLVGIGVSNAIKGKQWMNLYTKDLWWLLGFQAAALLFNIGDCGDAPGSTTLIERIALLGDDPCHIQISSSLHTVLPVFFFVCLWVYATALITITIRSALESTPVPAQALPFRYIRRTVIVSVVLLLLFILVSGYQHYQIRRDMNLKEENMTLFLKMMREDRCEDLTAFIYKSPQWSAFSENDARFAFESCMTDRAVRANNIGLCEPLQENMLQSYKRCVEKVAHSSR